VATTSKLLLTTSRFRVEEVEQHLPDGGVRKRQIVRHPGAVTILPMVDDRHVCLIRNFRIAVEQTLIELPAGTLEPDEEPIRTAERELTEETGYCAGKMKHLHSFYLSPGVIDEKMHLYVATDLELKSAAREPGEEIDNFVVPWQKAIDMIFSGQIQDAKSIVGLLYYDRLLNQRRTVSEA
jgi:ADP-ribose pyrophosphatase